MVDTSWQSGFRMGKELVGDMNSSSPFPYPLLSVKEMHT
jgi:hypothetical protein